MWIEVTNENGKMLVNTDNINWIESGTTVIQFRGDEITVAVTDSYDTLKSLLAANTNVQRAQPVYMDSSR